ncbi:DUF6603 domain-containing protein [Ruminococcus albus]|uniref:DUF6603 domain-containing protein n=1 Tax=Ruminococcus albus TaxID=1264 RepID=UPI000465BDBF|nr:DUF6603 domain-containing protein [Ruminococcus albus]
MIFFMINKGEDNKVKEDEYFEISDFYDEKTKGKITEANIQLIAWNQAKRNGKFSDNVKQLFTNILDVATHDDVCNNYAAQFSTLYAKNDETIDIIGEFKKYVNTYNPDVKNEDDISGIFKTVYEYWAHPMIGNVANSPQCRPQDNIDQYLKNWAKFDPKYMSEETKDRVFELCCYPGTAGLKKLEKSSRDQVRICKDWTELARAVIGEVTAYISKMLEKIFAFDLCASKKLEANQKKLLELIVNCNYKTGKKYKSLKNLFLCKKNRMEMLEYIYFYYKKDLDKLKSKESQWYFFASFINSIYEKIIPDTEFESVVVTADDKEIIKGVLDRSKLMPATMRCAMVFNAVRKFAYATGQIRNSIEYDEIDRSKFFTKCKVKLAADKNFIPTLEENMKGLLWSWTRDEKDYTTLTNRHYLMPLWAGPSGHSNGMMGFVDYYFNDYSKDHSVYFNKSVENARIVLPSMFAFWRLYYDKRITGVHSLAETFDASLYYFSTWDSKNKKEKNSWCNSEINRQIKEVEILKALVNEYDDPMDLLDGNAVFGSIVVMYRLYLIYYKKDKTISENIALLKDEIEKRKKAMMDKGLMVIEWSHDIIKSGEKIREMVSSVLSSVHITKQVVQLPPPAQDAPPIPQKAFSLCGSSDRFNALTEKIQQAQDQHEDFQFVKDEQFGIDPPQCLTDNGIQDFVGGMVFKNISGLTSADSVLTYNAEVDTSADCWTAVKEIISGFKTTENILCTVTENEEILVFKGEIEFGCSVTIGSVSLSIDNFTFESGLDNDWISTSIKGSITNESVDKDKTFEVTLYQQLYTSSLTIVGKCADENDVFTLTDLFRMFGLDDIDVSKVLPADESIFGSLGVKSVEMEVQPGSLVPDKFNFVISASNAWDIIPKKISFIPVFEIDIDHPSGGDTSVFCSATGRTLICGAEFDITLTTDLTIYAGLADGTAFNLKDFVNIFAHGVDFPEISVTDLTLMADFNTNDYSFSVAASDILSFDVGSTELGIDNVAFGLSCVNGNFGEVSLSGTFRLGGMELNVYGSYSGDNAFKFTADGYNDTEYTLGDLITDISAEFGCDIEETSFPAEYLTAFIRSLYVSYESKNNAFTADVDIADVLKFGDCFEVDDIKFHIGSSDDLALEFLINAYIKIVDVPVTLELKMDENGYSFTGNVEINVSVSDVLKSFNIDTSHLPEFILGFTVKNVDIAFEVGADTNKIHLGITTSLGELTVDVGFGAEVTWKFVYANSSYFDIIDMPVVGELIKIIDPNASGLTIGDFKITVSDKTGLTLSCKAFGENCEVSFFEPEKPQTQLAQNVGSSGIAFTGTAAWFKINKNILVLTVPKIGFGIDEKYISVLLDASLNVSPLTISLQEAGIGVSPEPFGVRFYLSGFSVGFDNGILSIGGGFSATENSGKTEYSGMLMIRFKDFGLAAMGSYSEGSMWAYLSLNAPIGGIPEFFVKGIAAGFGYNRRLILPPIEKVAEYPLVLAAMCGFDKNPKLLEDFKTYMVEESDQYFLTAGLKFTTYETLTGLLLVTVSFGNDFELGLLGLADLTVPPNIGTDFIARAQLAIKTSIRPTEGVFSAEAQLTNESYILSKSCKLTGGFAAYLWFGNNEHSGDFVITLGGYHPSFVKPDHYPVVPRLGLNWNIDEHIKIIGEIYFAFTPSTLMAGGKLSATYSQGDLRAWFTAYTDMLLNWKPFTYYLAVGVTVGASYTVNIWKIHKTFSVELGADLHLWGPEVNGKVKISWYIISFTISFSMGECSSNDPLKWEEFKDSFLTDGSSGNKEANLLEDNLSDILTISLEGAVGQTEDETPIISSQGLVISAESKIPKGEAYVRPVDSPLKSELTVVVERDSDDITSSFDSTDIKRNLPAALWGEKPEDKLKENPVRELECGTKLTIKNNKMVLFPENCYIVLSELYEDNTIGYGECFAFADDVKHEYSDEDTIEIFTANETDLMEQKRNEFLKSQLIDDSVSITKFADEADNWLAEEILIIRS